MDPDLDAALLDEASEALCCPGGCEADMGLTSACRRWARTELTGLQSEDPTPQDDNLGG